MILLVLTLVAAQLLGLALAAVVLRGVLALALKPR